MLTSDEQDEIVNALELAGKYLEKQTRRDLNMLLIVSDGESSALATNMDGNLPSLALLLSVVSKMLGEQPECCEIH